MGGEGEVRKVVKCELYYVYKWPLTHTRCLAGICAGLCSAVLSLAKLFSVVTEVLDQPQATL